MTNNQSNEPYQPFHVQSDLLKNAAQQGSKARQGSSGSGKPAGTTSNNPFGNWDLGDARWLVMPLFAAIYWITDRDALLRPMTILVLLACLLFRMEPRARGLAGVPLTLAAMKLAYQMTPSATVPSATFGLLSEQTRASIVGVPWVPMFLAICIFYLPQKATVTGTIVRLGAIGVLMSGLIPGDGYVAVLALFQYTLFMGVLVGLIADHSWNGGARESSGTMQAARS
jgi:hypothetical protein